MTLVLKHQAISFVRPILGLEANPRYIHCMIWTTKKHEVVEDQRMRRRSNLDTESILFSAVHWLKKVPRVRMCVTPLRMGTEWT